MRSGKLISMVMLSLALIASSGFADSAETIIKVPPFDAGLVCLRDDMHAHQSYISTTYTEYVNHLKGDEKNPVHCHYADLAESAKNGYLVVYNIPETIDMPSSPFNGQACSPDVYATCLQYGATKYDLDNRNCDNCNDIGADYSTGFRPGAISAAAIVSYDVPPNVKTLRVGARFTGGTERNMLCFMIPTRSAISRCVSTLDHANVYVDAPVVSGDNLPIQVFISEWDKQPDFWRTGNGFIHIDEILITANP